MTDRTETTALSLYRAATHRGIIIGFFAGVAFVGLIWSLLT